MDSDSAAAARGHRRAMLRTALGCGAALLAGNLLAGALGLRWETPGTRPQLQKLAAFRRGAGSGRRVDVVFLGSSHTKTAVVPELLEAELEQALGRPFEVWNLAVAAAVAPMAEALQLELFAGPLQAPRVLVIEADPLFWNEARDDHGTEQYWRWFAPAKAIATAVAAQPWTALQAAARRAGWGLEALWQQPLYALDARLSRMRVQYQRGHGSRWNRTKAARGAAQDDEEWREVSDPAEAAALLETRRQLVRPLRTLQEWRPLLGRIAARAQAGGAEVVLLNQPVTETFMALYEPGAYAAHLAALESAAAEFGIRLVDLNVAAFRDPGEFANLDHLSAAAAPASARRLALEVLLPSPQVR
ncbi:MAG TPA: hypothetical protein VGC54_02145 [Planctomycetota bacterium]